MNFSMQCPWDLTSTDWEDDKLSQFYNKLLCQQKSLNIQDLSLLWSDKGNTEEYKEEDASQNNIFNR